MGSVNYYEGLYDKYPNSEYLFFLSAGERNNTAYRIFSNEFTSEDDGFNEMTFTGAQIKSALRGNDEYEDTNDYWAVALEVINFLKQKAGK
jgi:hypothetical protein